MSVAVLQEEGIARVVLRDPPLNILTRAVLASLRAELAALSGEGSLRVLLLEAEGRHFSAGASVTEHLAPEVEAMLPEFCDTVRMLYGFPLPVIAAVRGRCLGGAFELVQAADIVIAGESALFAQPEIQLGVMPPAACVLLPELTGAQLAAELIYSGEPITALEAAAFGLVRRIVPDEAVGDEAFALALRIRRHSAVALRASKRALRGATAARVAAGLSRTSEIYLHELMRSRDATEGLQAFLEKRRPEWSHS